MENVFKWRGLELPLCDDANEEIILDGVTPEAPKNLRVCSYPYPHLRDDDGTVLARDYAELGKLAYILDALDAYDPR
jgi:hypothetical protein